MRVRRCGLRPAREPLGHDLEGRPVFLADIWPDQREVADIVARSLRPEMFATAYKTVFDGDVRWRGLPAPQAQLFPWNPISAYLRKPTYLDDFTRRPPLVRDIEEARVLVKLGDSVTTDHISPAGAIPVHTPAGTHLTRLGVSADQLNTYASRRGDHEVMMRGAFANVRLRNHLTPDAEGGYTDRDGTTTTIYEAAEAYRRAGTLVIVIAGRNYGAGSSRDWAAKGPALLGVRAVLACDFERIHRSNLVGMGILPLQFLDGQDADTLGLTGHETYTITGLTALNNGVLVDTRSVAWGYPDEYFSGRPPPAGERQQWLHQRPLSSVRSEALHDVRAIAPHTAVTSDLLPPVIDRISWRPSVRPAPGRRSTRCRTRHCSPGRP